MSKTKSSFSKERRKGEGKARQGRRTESGLREETKGCLGVVESGGRWYSQHAPEAPPPEGHLPAQPLGGEHEKPRQPWDSVVLEGIWSFQQTNRLLTVHP